MLFLLWALMKSTDFAKRFYRLKDVISVTTLSRSTIYRYMDDGLFPKQIEIAPKNRCLVRKWCSKMDVRKDWNAHFLISPWKTSNNALNIQKKANFQGFWWWGWGTSKLIPLFHSHPFSMTLIFGESEYHPLRFLMVRRSSISF